MAHFLSGLGEERRSFLRREVKYACCIYYLRNGMRGHGKRDAMLVNISEDGCLFTCLAASQLPEHVYLVIDGVPFKFSCAIVNRKEERVNVKFATCLPTDFVDKLAAPRVARA